MTSIRAMRRTALGVAASALVSLSCGKDGGPTGPSGPVTVTISLASPRSDDGALLLRLTGRGLTAEGVRAASDGYFVQARPAAAGGVTVLIVGDIVSGPLLRVDAPDAESAEGYAASVKELASRANALVSANGVSVSVVR
jgi:hypothetical protein